MRPGGVSTCPRRRSSVDSPARLTATRVPGSASSRSRRCVCRPRMRAVGPSGVASTLSPTRSRPSSSVPVTTVPKPAIVKTRSMPSRGRPMSRGSGVPSRAASSVSFSASRPCRSPDGGAAVRTIGAPASVVVSISVRTSSSTRSSQPASSTMSHFVSATTAWSTPSRSRISRCSRVCGITPSSAATTNSARSMAPAPASMWRTKRTWPGTSTMETSRAEGRVSQAKPSSMVRPRSCSSRRRSGCVPVSASISADLPWSTCPAVPMTYMGGSVVGVGGWGAGGEKLRRLLKSNDLEPTERRDQTVKPDALDVDVIEDPDGSISAGGREFIDGLRTKLVDYLCDDCAGVAIVDLRHATDCRR